MKKQILFHELAEKDYTKLPETVQNELDDLLNELAEEGLLRMPYARKLKGYDLFEIRIKKDGYWRVIYAYHAVN